jgi:hypothetical protein
MAASFDLGSSLLFSALSIAQGAAEIAEGMQAADREAEATRQQRRAERRQMRQTERAGIEKRQQEGERRATRLRSLGTAWEKLTGKPADSADIEFPAAPNAVAAQAHAAWLAALDERIAKLETLLTETAATRGGDVAAVLATLLAAGTSAQEQLAAFLAQARLAGATPDVAALRQQLVARVLERIERAADEPLPPTLDALALQVVEAPTQERAEALATELRFQVQRHNTARAAAAEDAQLREAAVVVLEQSLKDLGYAVEDIEETLFVEGGIAHFQRPEWGDYFVRLRIDPKRGAMNFNVVRAGTAGEDRKREDMLAEERWCADHPQLFATLKARGLTIDVTRLLQAGEAPVQVVDASSLPAATNNEERRHGHDKLMQLDGKAGH